MGNGRKQTALWLVFVEGAALSLGIYLLLTVLLSALVVKAVLTSLKEHLITMKRRKRKRVFLAVL